jgi:hypothetical protein
VVDVERKDSGELRIRVLASAKLRLLQAQWKVPRAGRSRAEAG